MEVSICNSLTSVRVGIFFYLAKLAPGTKFEASPIPRSRFHTFILFNSPLTKCTRRIPGGPTSSNF